MMKKTMISLGGVYSRLNRLLTLVLIGMSLLTASMAGAAVKPAWQEKWESTLEAARKEGSVVMITGAANELRGALSKAFKDKFGLNIEYVTGRGTGLINKIFTERRSGLYLSDLYLAGITSNVKQLKPSGVLASIKDLLLLPEVTDPKAY